jgi:hypothetical protein
MTARIALVADIHHGRDTEAKKGTQALALLGDFAAFVRESQVDLVIDLGDRISDEDAQTDARLQREVAEAFRPIAEVAPVFHICGNHDRDHLGVEDNEAILGQPLQHATIDVAGWRVALFRADSRIRRPGGFVCPQSDITWLEGVVRGADRPLLVASHVPFSGHSQIGNYYFENTPELSTYPQAAALRAALAQGCVPTACIAGHVHWNTVTTVDGIPHFTQQSLTESFTTGDQAEGARPCGAFGLIELSGQSIEWRVFGADSLQVSMPLAQTARRWRSPMPRIDVGAARRAASGPVETTA